MSLSDDLIEHSSRLLGAEIPQTATDADLRRAVSAAYYAIFHEICGAAATLFAPNVSDEVRSRVQRWFDHTEIRHICGQFAQAQLDQPLRDLLGTTASDDMRFVAQSFIRLQDERHKADYDLAYTLSWSDARAAIKRSIMAAMAWKHISETPEANIFMLSLLMWKNWKKER